MQPIAIIGIGCRFADATDPREYFELLKRGVDATIDAPEDRWNLRSFYDPDRAVPGKLMANRGGFLPNIDRFDAHFFGISPREAACMDPQQRLMLEVSWEAMEDAGIVPQSLGGRDVGVFVGAFTLDYKAIQLGYLNRDRIDTHTATGAMMTMVSNRISYAFDFRGPSMSIDTACSSSLVAVHLACASLRNEECTIALAGGVNVMAIPEYTIAESKGGFLAPDGRSKPFSAGANGYGRAEGAGVVVLKPLSVALAAGDPIYAVIRGSAVNQDGHTNGITVPSGEAQSNLIQEACRRAGVIPGRIQYVEAHGTGTPVGDPIEIGALAQALAAGRPEGDRCIIGSVKGNIGHAEAGAGVAGLIKAAMCVQNRAIPPNVHFENPNPKIPFDQLPVRVPTTLEPWPASAGTALAGVNSFGFGGTNAHVIIEESPVREGSRPSGVDPHTPVLVPLSARSPEALSAMARSMSAFARQSRGEGIGLSDIYYTAAFRRSHHDQRLAVVARTGVELADSLDAWLNGETRAAVSSGTAPASRPKLAFVCTGMGPQWWAMGRQLFSDEPVFRRTLLAIDDVFVKLANWSLVIEMMAEEKQSRMADTSLAQPANFAIQVGLAEMWKSWGIVPDAIVGHSVGEVSAAYLSGALSLEEAVRVSYHRSRLQQTTAGAGAMLAVGLSEQDILPWLDRYEGRISVAAVNSPSSATVSGDPAAVTDLATQLTAKGVFNRPLRVNIAYHSAQMDRLRDELMESLAGLNPRATHTPLYSTVTGAAVSGVEFDAAYWWRNVREPVRFRAAIDNLSSDGVACFLEVGPHPVLASSISECMSATGKKAASFHSLRRGEDERATMMGTLGGLYAAGFPVNWEAFRTASAGFVRFPAYPWQRERYWSESEASIADRTGAAAHPLLGRRTSSARPTWETEINTRLLSYLPDHAIRGAAVFPGAGYVEMALAAAKELFGDAPVAVEEIRFERALFLPNGEYPKVQIAIDPDSGAFEINSRAGENAWARNASGKLRHDGAATPALLDVSTIVGRCTPAVERSDCYERFTGQGFHYGPAFQKIDRLQTGIEEAVAWFADIGAVDEEYTLHPTVLDGCFQVLVATDPFRSEDGTTKTYMPVGIERIRVMEKPRGAMWAWARLTAKDASGATGSITVCDSMGRVVLEIEGFEVKTLDASSGAMSREQMDRSLYEVRWIATDDSSRAEAAEFQARTWVLLADEAGVAEALAARIRNEETRVIVARPGSAFGFNAADSTATLDPAAPEHWTSLLQDAMEGNSAQTIGVVHMWNLDLAEPPQSVDDLGTAESIGAASVLQLVQAMVRAGVSARLSIVTRGTQPVDPEDRVAIQQSAVWGLGRVAGHQEHINLWGGLIDLDPAAPEGEVDALLEEITHTSTEDQVAFRATERFAARLTRSTDLSAPSPIRLRADGSYIVTGAFGALGMLTARWMAGRGARRLILMGRSAVPERSQWGAAGLPQDVERRVAFVRGLEAMGCSVTLAPVDVADELQLAAFLADYERKGWPPIRGVVHSAGLVRDQLLVQMDAAAFADVLRPKIRGAWNLHRMLGRAPLDFFVLYSSIGSLVAAAGQANYAAANAFLDALAHHRKRQGLPAIAINWGPWAVGMVKDLNLMEHYAARGMDCITPEQGMAYLARLMGQRTPQAAVLSADWPQLASFQAKIPAMLADLANESAQEAGSKASDGEDFVQSLILAEPADQPGIMEGHLQGLAARVLRTDRDKVSTSQPLSALGLDSMMAMELKNRIELALRIPISVLDLLKGASVAELAQSLLPRLIDENPELRTLLAELEQIPGPQQTQPYLEHAAMVAEHK